MMGVGGIGAGVHAWGGSGGAGGAASGARARGRGREGVGPGARRGLSMRLARAVVSSSIYANAVVSSLCFVCVVTNWQLVRYHKACLLVSVGCV